MRDIPLPVAPGLNAVGSTPDDKLRAARLAKIRYDNPALSEEYWQDLPKDWFVPEFMRRAKK